MKIYHVCLSKGKGGLELYVVKVLTWLNNKGSDVGALVAPHSFTAKKLDQACISYKIIKPWSIYFPLISAYRLAQVLKNQKIDIIHMHCRKDLGLAVMAKMLSSRPVKLVYTRQMSMSRSKKDIYHTFLYNRLDKFITISKELYDQAVKNLPMPEEKIKLLYYGVPAPASRSLSSCDDFFSKAGTCESSFKVGLFGRIEEGKGQHLLVKAVKKLLDKGKDIEAVLIGHITDESQFKLLMLEIERLGLSGKIHYYGFHQNPVNIMACFDAVVLATYKETFGLVLAEAMRAGTAVIGSDAGGVPEIIDDGETGLLFKTRNADSLAENLERLVGDRDLCERLALRGKEKADALFSEEQHFDELEKIYKSV